MPPTTLDDLFSSPGFLAIFFTILLTIANIVVGVSILPSDQREKGYRIHRLIFGAVIISYAMFLFHLHQISRTSIFANIVFADEINRTPPKTQAALLEAMQEHKVTTGGQTYDLDEPFFVLATQNPIEQEGTYPLPEAQLDRFMFNLNIDYPSTTDEIAIVRKTTTIETQLVQAIMSKQEIASYQDLVRRVPVADNVVEYAVKLVSATRPDSDGCPDFIRHSVDWGAGPRASQYLVLGAKAKAVLEGRPTPNINDIRDLTLPILRHRVLPNFNAEAEGLKIEDILKQLLGAITE